MYGSAGVQHVDTVEKNAFQRVKDVITGAGQNMRDAVQGNGQYQDQAPLTRGIAATAASFNAVPQTALALAPKPVRDVASAAGDVVSSGFNALTSLIGSNPALQKWTTDHPEATTKLMELAQATSDLGQVAGNIAGAKGTSEAAKVGGSVVKTGSAGVIEKAQDAFGKFRPTMSEIAAERTAKIKEGFQEQNTRLKSGNSAFNENTIIRKNLDGETTTITPIDTLADYEIAPIVEKGTLNMGDYRTGDGALGKIKERVGQLDADIDTKLTNTGQKISIDELEAEALQQIESNPELMRAGKVASTQNSLKTRFEDYRNSYGTELDIAELNNIRKVANKDWSPDTQDVSRVIGDVARNYVYDAVPDGEVKSLLQRQGELLAAKRYAESINGTKVTGGRLGNYAMRAAGATIGTTVDNMPVAGPMLGMVGGEYAARALQQSQFKSLWTELRALIAKDDSNTPSQTGGGQ